MTPFEQFYEETFEPLLAKLKTYDSGPVFTDGSTINDVSWDRKAAFLLYMIVNGMDAPE